MPNAELLKKEIDTSENEILEAQEMEEFLKSEENIKKLWETMDSNISSEILWEMEDALKNLCENFLTLDNLTDNQNQILSFFTERFWNKYPELKEELELNKIIDWCIVANNILPNNVQNINERCNLIWNKSVEKLNKIKEILQNKIDEISKNVNKIIAANKAPGQSPYTSEQIQFIQLWGNVFYWANLEITGKRWNMKNTDSSNEWKTNIYIYKLELMTRQDVIDIRKEFNQLLNIPNLDAKFAWISADAQEKIMTEFLKFFLDIKGEWMYFENDIWNDSLEKVLTFIIDAEKYKNITIDDYLNQYFSDDLTDEEKSQRNSLEQGLQQYQTIWWYFESQAQQLKNLCLQHKDNQKELNSEIALQNKIKEFYTLFAEVKWDSNQKEKLEKLWKDILNNPRLKEEQRKEILIMIWWAFSEIETNWKKFDITYNWRKCDWLVGKAPNSILYTPWCNVRVEYDDSEEKYGWPINIKIYLDEKPLKLSDEFKILRSWYDIHVDDNDCLIIKKLWWDWSELQNTFWNEVYEEYQNAQNEYNKKLQAYEEVNDVISQIESNDKIEIIEISEENKETINNETGYTERYNKYKNELKWYNNANRAWNSLTRADYGTYTKPKEPISPSYEEYHYLKIPGCEWKLVHIKPSEWENISKVIQNYWDDICFTSTNKSDGLIYELTLSDLKISEKDNEWNIHLCEINDNWIKWNEVSKISAEDINEAKHTNDLIMTSINMTPWLRNALDNAKNISDDIQYIWELYKKFDRSNPESVNYDEEWKKINKWLTNEDVYNIRVKAVEIADSLNELCKHHNDLVQLKKWLEKRYSWESNINTEDEQRRKSYIDNLDYLINATTEWWDIYKYCDSMLNAKNVHSNDQWLERVGRRFIDNWIKTLSAIAGWVLAVCFVPVTWWGSLAILAKMAMVTTAWWMIWWLVWQVVNEWLQNLFIKDIITEDWRRIDVRYDDPTSLEMACKWEISRWDFTLQTWIQFIMWAATTFWCMYAWNLVWWWITKACESWNISPKFKIFLEKCNKNFKVDNWDPTTDELFKTMANKIWQSPTSLIKSFNARFFEEFKDELSEEFTETWFEEISNWLRQSNTWLALLLSWIAALATAWHCLTPWWNMSKVYTENWISIWDVDIPQGKNTLEITLDYNWDYNAIVDYYHANGFKTVNWHLEMKNPDNPALTNIIYLHKTDVSLEARSLASQLSWYWISIDTETWKWYYKTWQKYRN